MNPQSNRVVVALVAALLVPRIEELTHVKLTLDDVAALVGLSVALWHGAARAFVTYFPPPSPKAEPAAPAKEPT